MVSNLAFLYFVGLNTIHLEIINLEQILKETVTTQPILLLTRGSDPSIEIRQLAKTVVGYSKYIEVSTHLYYRTIKKQNNLLSFHKKFF